MIRPVLKAIADEPNHHLKSLWIDSGASDEHIEEVSRMKTLEEVHITNCSYINGMFLGELRTELARLKVLDFRGSYQIGIAEIRECVKNHA
jgi:hypothetical protein